MIQRAWSAHIICMTLLFGQSLRTSHAQVLADQAKRPVTVADSIRMTRLGDVNYNFGAMAKPKVAEFSSDGKRFVVVLRKGNLEDNTNEYQLLLFYISSVFSSPRPEILLKMSSSSNRPAIQSVTWLEDNETLVFLGEHPGEKQQLYTLNCRTKKLKRLTDHPTSLSAYSVSKGGRHFAFVAETPAPSTRTAKTARHGVLITNQLLPDLIAGEERVFPDEYHEVLFQGTGSRHPKRLQLPAILRSWAGIKLSPDGRHLLVMTRVPHVPNSWKEYADENLQKILRYGSNQYTLVDTRGGQSRPLIDAPIGYWGTEVAWSPDGRSVVVTNVHLPLDGVDGAERELRRKSPFVVEVKVPSGEIVKLPTSDLRLLRWDGKTGKVVLQSGRMNAITGKDVPKVAYVRNGDTWALTNTPVEPQDLIEVSLDEDMNTPPKIFVRDVKSAKRDLLLDLNPHFRELRLARVERIRWRAIDGHDVDGGLYFPPDYVPGQKYPLILQTHGFAPHRFWMDGPWTTAFAAQALASKGFLVLQIPDWPDLEQYPKIGMTQAEGPYQMSTFEGAIDYLDAQGLIDRDRVGIIGFSRSGFYVKFTLTHSKYPFAAAAISDSTDVGFMNYLAFSNSVPSIVAEGERMIGSAPFGTGLESWLNLSPAFNVQKVRTPIRIEALSHRSLLFEWEWFAALSRLGKPVDFIYQPAADHIIEKPWERLVSQQGNVDWFCFWLKNEEDPDPAKAGQYAHWRRLREQHQQNTARQN